MSTNKGFIMSYNNNNGWIPLYPFTLKSQIIGWNLGESYGPYEIILYANNWINNQQIIDLNGVIESDILYCLKILSGTQEQMIAQDEAYGLLDPIVGIESLYNQIRFTCTSNSPTIDLTLQISWVR